MISPPEPVLAAFGAGEGAVPLPGGKGETWRAGAMILKPAEFAPETRWRAEILAALPESPHFRLAHPVRARDGSWTADGWECSRFVPGEPDLTRIDDVLHAGIAFHAAVAHLPRPDFLDVRDDPWTTGDRAAWGAVHGSAPVMALLTPLVEARRPGDLPGQAVHGDLPGNVLFAAGLPPAIIDWSVYWRPAPWAAAVAVVDALCWYGAARDLPARWSQLPEWGQMLLRALIYRIVTDDIAFGPDGWTPDRLRVYRGCWSVVREWT